MFDVPDALVRTATETRGDVGAEWVRRLPLVLSECARRWSLTLEPPFAALSYNYAAPARRADGTPVVLKVGFPQDRELLTEAKALRLFDGRGAVRLLEADLSQGALLLERLKPGTALITVRDEDEAIASAAAVLRELWRPVPAEHTFPTVAEWAAGLSQLRRQFDGTTGPFPTALVEESEALFAELLSSMDTPVLLHGDLNYGNVLRAQRRPWLAIDPKGVVGEPAYDTGVLLRDPLPHILSAPDPKRLLARRIDQLSAELGFARARIRDWALAQAVLSAYWTLEDHGHGWEPRIAGAELLASITR